MLLLIYSVFSFVNLQNLLKQYHDSCVNQNNMFVSSQKQRTCNQ